MKNKFNIRDFVTIIKIPDNLRNSPELQTKKAFDLCLGKTYQVTDIDRYGHLELMVGKDVDAIIGVFMNTIWIEPECVEPAKKQKNN